MPDITVARLQEYRLPSPPPLLNVMYCVRVTLTTVKIFLASATLKSRGSWVISIPISLTGTNLDVKDLVAGHDEVAEADDRPLPDRQAGGAQMRLQRLQQVRVELHQQAAKPEQSSVADSGMFNPDPGS